MSKSYNDIPSGGSVSLESPFYIERESDIDLYNSLNLGEFCYVLNSRQTGKSSLKLRISKRLEKNNNNVITCIFIDLSAIGTPINESQWYASQLKRITKQLKININIEEWWNSDKNKSLSSLTKYASFLEEILLAQITNNIVIFIDEIDTVLGLRFSTDDFFAFIRSCHEERHINAEYKRLTFCLLGVALPDNLIKDQTRTPFNIGKEIILEPFNINHVKKLTDELKNIEVRNNEADKIMKEIIEWTGGQPFLTMQLYKYVLQSLDENKFSSIEAIVNSNKITGINYSNNQKALAVHFNTIKKGIIQNEEKTFVLLDIYENILSNKFIKADGSNEQLLLILSGLVLQKKDHIRIYNPIYEKIFNYEWIRQERSKLFPFPTKFESWIKEDKQTNDRKTQHQLFLLSEQSIFLEAWEWREERKRQNPSIDLGKIYEFLLDSRQILQKAENYLHNGSNSDAIIQAMNYWTGGLKEFNDRIFDIAKPTEPPENGLEIEWVEKLIKSELQDCHRLNSCENLEICNYFCKFVNLKEIEQIFLDETISDIEQFKLISQYKNIFDNEYVVFDESPEHKKLQEMCFIIKKDDCMRILNRIYRLIFDEKWIDKILLLIRPYAKSFINWEPKKDKIYLLKQGELQSSIEWIRDVSKISQLELEFIVTSLVWQEWNSSDYSIKDEAKNLILKFYCERLRLKLDNPLILISESLKWTIGNPTELKKLLNWICSSTYVFSDNPNEYYNLLRQVINSNIKKLGITEIYGYLDLNRISRSFWHRDMTIEKLNLMYKFVNSAISLESEKNVIKEIIKAFDEYPQSSYDHEVNKFEIEVLTFLNNIFLRARAKFMADQLDKLLNSTVEESDVIEAIAIVNLKEGTLEYNNKEFKSKRPDVYQALFGRKDSSEALGEFGGLIGIPKALNTFGEATKYGTLEYSMFYLTEGIIVVYFMDLPELRAAICFIATKEAQLGSLVRQCRKKIDDIKKELDKQFA